MVNHPVKRLHIKEHNVPKKASNEEDVHGKVKVPDVELRPHSKKDGGWKAWMARSMQKIFCLHKDNEKCMWEDHVDSKKERRRTKAQFRSLHVPVVSGSKNSVTGFDDWKSPNGIWESSDEDEVQSSRRRARPPSNIDLSG